jgi:hypothetical protein
MAREAKGLTAKIETNNRSSDAATVLTPASSANSRSSGRRPDKKGASSSSEARNKVHATEAPTATPWASAGMSVAKAMAAVTSSSVVSAAMAKRCMASVYGLGSWR